MAVLYWGGKLSVRRIVDRALNRIFFFSLRRRRLLRLMLRMLLLLRFVSISNSSNGQPVASSGCKRRLFPATVGAVRAPVHRIMVEDARVGRCRSVCRERR